MPGLQKIDHIHIYVPDRKLAEQWYCGVMGFSRVESLAGWAVDGGPLTIGSGDVHIALFEQDGPVGNTVALAASANAYEQWKVQLSEHQISFRESDHDLSWSIYFSDPYGNPYEITTYT
ncbi:VOC family protein [Vibrio profundum]|uniref:VOC family protein n=1 Tax=Vibrio profundum TaxID=2910247 RepID=UPI003D15044C